MIIDILKDKFSDYLVLDIILKLWLLGLVALWTIGMVTLIVHLITNPYAIDNATFGVFDTLGG